MRTARKLLTAPQPQQSPAGDNRRELAGASVVEIGSVVGVGCVIGGTGAGASMGSRREALPLA